MKTKAYYLTILFTLSLLKTTLSQTVLSAGDMAVIGFKTNTSTDAGNDAIKLLTLVDLQCNTKFIVTDNNWNNTIPGWACNDDEFAIEITCNTTIVAGSIFYLDVDASGNAVNCSGGSVSASDLGSPWGTNYGLSSQGDNIYVLQGTRATATFIFAIKHSAFSNTTCSNKDQAGLPTGLSIGNGAVAMSSVKDQWHFNCVTNTGSKATIISAICSSANWTNSSGQSWNNTSGIFTVTDAGLPYGVLAVSGAGCGCLANCNLAYAGSINCGSTGVTGNCTAGYQNMLKNIIVPLGCTYAVTATMKNRGNGCSSSGADGNCPTCDLVKVDVLGGSKTAQQGGSNSSISDTYTSIGPSTIVVSGRADRADEIITYGISMSPCNCLLTLLPVELVNFNAINVEEAVELSWATMVERNNDYFMVERSVDAVSWEMVLIIGGQGSSSIPYHYSVYDSSPLSGISYYRLKQTDVNEKYTYSEIRSVNRELKQKKIVRRINLLGVEIDEDASGLVILIYEDGEVKKIYK